MTKTGTESSRDNHDKGVQVVDSTGHGREVTGEGDRVVLGHSDTDADRWVGTTWGLKGGDGHNMSPQQAQAHAVYEKLVSEIRLRDQLVYDTAVTGLTDAQLKKALLVKEASL